MGDLADAIQAAAGLAFGGFLFIVVGGALTSSMSSQPMIDLEFWGVIYILVAFVLAIAVVAAAAISILNQL